MSFLSTWRDVSGADAGQAAQVAGRVVLACLVLALAACGGGSSGGGGGTGSSTSSGSTSGGGAPDPVLTVTTSGTGTVSSSPAGINNCSGSCTANYASGTSVTLSAQAGAGYVFAGWGGACSGNAACVVSMNSATTVSALFAVAGSKSLSVTLAGTGAGTVVSTPAGIDCTTGTCLLAVAAGTAVTLTAAPAAGSTLTAWTGLCSGSGATCSFIMANSGAVTASFSLLAGSACARNAQSLVWAVPPTSNIFNWANSNPNTGGSFGNYVVAMDDYTSVNATTWVNDQNCWGATTGVTADNSAPVIAPNVTRGWIYNATVMDTLSDAGTQNWTTKSGMGIQVSALTKAKVHWAISVPSAAYPATRWDALLDIFFHTMQLPTQSNGWYPEVDLQIMHSLMDSGYYKALACPGGSAQNVTLGGVQYAVVVDVAGPFNQTGGHTITMFTHPTTCDTATTNLWGAGTNTHDLQAIIAFWSKANPKDDNGNPIVYSAQGWSTLKGQAVTTALINPSWYFTAVNGDFEIDMSPSTADYWTTNDFWVAVQNEPDGQ